MIKIIVIIKKVILWPIYIYRYAIRPFLPRVCRFEPSCSEYAIEAVQILGPLKGLCKIIGRISRCHPWCAGGYDPIVSDKEKTKRRDKKR